jgi:hypothetical protein
LKYVSIDFCAWRDTAGKAPKAFVPLAFEPGEAFQLDWSDEA